MEKQYRLDGVPIRVKIQEGLVRIVNDLSFKQAADKQLQVTTRTLVTQIKTDYKAIFGCDLAIPDDSFITEIWGHLYADYFLLRYRRMMKCILIFGLYDRFLRSCEVIDCGERGKDPNRWLWNKLTPFQKLLGRRLAIAPISRFAECRRR